MCRRGRQQHGHARPLSPCVIYGSTGFGGVPGSTQSSLIAADADFTIETPTAMLWPSGTARCGANFILFSSADVVADSAYALKAGDSSSTEGTAAERDDFPPAWAWATASPAADRSRTESRPRGFDGQMPNGGEPELPRRGGAEMPSGERPHQRQGKPADGNAPAGDSTLRYHSTA